MRLIHSLFAFVSLVSIFALPALAEQSEPSIIPRPVSLQRNTGVFHLTDQTPIVVDTASRPTGEYLAALLKPATGFQFPVVDDSNTSATTGEISLRIVPSQEFADEGYHLDISTDAVHLTAKTPAGLFYGVQTLRQLLPPEIESTSKTDAIEWTVPALSIDDSPGYKWRGLHLDCGRHFRDVAYIKRFLDLMALHKLNTFHWHLTEDQGWRIEIKKYPKLTEIGAWRDDGHGGKYGGFYTQDQIRDVVAYAAARHITIVPEIEMPGHSVAALAAYPELSCTGGPFKVETKWGVFNDVYCPGKEHTFEFLEDVLTEVMELFPGTFIHIGGDECPKDRWQACPDCQARIKAEGLKDEHELQSYFIKRIDTFVTSKGRRIIGWDEILEGGLAPGAAVMSWHESEGGMAAARAGHDTVMTPMSHCYFDHYQSHAPGQPKAIGGYLPIETVYGFEPSPPELSPADAVHVLGGQGNLWSEYFENDAQVDYMTYPRAAALAEALWTPTPRRGWEDFSQRLKTHLRRLDVIGVKYFKEPVAAAAP
jgi:hexosaminidase